ncbi:MAG: hypothetical protein ING69_10800 [Rhodocyclaceae bacterium]|nr:hypothetical protein [Rhodocyclaceae bacterium]
MRTPDNFNRDVTPEELAQFQRGVAMQLALTFVPCFALLYSGSFEVLIGTFVGMLALMNAWYYRWAILDKIVDFILAGGDKK